MKDDLKYIEVDRNIMFNKSGSGSVNMRVSLPVPWMRAIGITQENKDVKLTLKNNKVIISKK